MRNWLKKFEETTVGLLFQDQYLSPSEVVRIAERNKTQRCGTACNDVESLGQVVASDAVATPQPTVDTTHLIGMR
jgi:hypothetical protein